MNLCVWPSGDALDEELLTTLPAGQARHLLPGLATDTTWEALLDEIDASWPCRALDPVAARLALRAAAITATLGTSLARVAETRGFVSAAARFVAECERQGLSPQTVASAAAQVEGGAGERLGVLAAIYAGFVKATRPAGLSRDRRRARVVERLADAAPLPLDRLRRVCLEPRLFWESIDVQTLVALAQRLGSRGGTVEVKLPYTGGSPVYAGLEPVLAAFEATREPGGLELLFEDPAESCRPGLRGLLGALYRPGVSSLAPEGATVSMRVLCAPSADAELRLLASRARDLVDGGVPPEAIVVAARTPTALCEALDEALARVGLALEAHVDGTLAETPLAKFVLSLFGLPARGFPREEVLAILASRYVIVPRNRTLEVAARARALGLRALDLQALPRVDAEAQGPLASALASLARLPSEGTVAEHVHALEKALYTLGVAPSVRAASLERSREPALARTEARIERALARDQAALDALATLLAKLPLLARDVGLIASRLSRAAFTAQLADAMAEVPLRTGRKRGGAIRLLALAHLAGRSFPHVFVPRLLDGEAPAHLAEDGVYGRRERHAMNRALGRHALPATREDSTDRTPFELLWLASALWAARTSITLSYPATVDGRNVLRSPFVDEILRAAPWVPIVRVPQALVPRHGELRSADDVLARLAVDLYADPEARLPSCPPPPTGPPLWCFYERARRALPQRVARLARVAKIERARFRFFCGPGDEEHAHAHVGDVGPVPGLRARVGGTEQRPLPVRLFESMANCPFTFFAERVLGVIERDEAGDAPDARDTGRLAHLCLQAFYEQCHREGTLPLATNRDPAPLFQAVAAAIVAKEEAKGHPGHPVLWSLAKVRVMSELARYLGREAGAGTPKGGVPTYFELAFGGREAALPALSVASGEETVYLSGRIDRVDVLAGGAGFVVVDYKSGSKAAHTSKLQPAAVATTALQLPVYAAALRKGLAATLAPDAQADGVFVSLRDGAPTRSLAETCGQEELATLLADVLPARLNDLAARMRQGHFEVRPVDCSHCRYRTVCRVMSAPHAEDDAEDDA